MALAQRPSGTGIWSAPLRYGELQPAAEAAVEVEELGYTAIWLPDVGGDLFAAVENLLSGQVDTGPRHLIDPQCKKLIAALRSGYRYKVKTTGEVEPKPEKNMHSHLADAHQYAALHVDQIFGGAYDRLLQQGQRRIVPASMKAWT